MVTRLHVQAGVTLSQQNCRGRGMFEKMQQASRCTSSESDSCLHLAISSYKDDQSALSHLKGSQQIKEVYISGEIPDEDVGLLCDDLPANSLEKVTLELSECSDVGCVHIAGLIQHSHNIKEVSLLLNNVSEKGARILSEGLSRSTLENFGIYATQLDLHDHCIGDVGAAHIAEAIHTHRTLRSVCVAQNGVSNKGLSNIIESLKRNNVITELDLHSNCIDSEGARLIGSYLSKNTTLKKLVLKENHGIQSEGAKEIALSLSTNSSLENLSLRSCGIGQKGAERFALALSENTTIRVLDLCGNIDIGDDAVELISRGLKENKSLVELNLSCCGLGDEGCSHLADALLVNSTLVHLWLQKNEIGDGGILSLCESLRQNSALSLLSVAGNRFSQKASTALAQTLSHNSTLTTLDIDGDKDIGSTVDILLDKNRQLLHYKNWTKELLKRNKELVKERDALQKQIRKKSK